jgi:hypothetical protein
MLKKCVFWSVSTEPVEEDAFEFTKTGQPRKNSNEKAAQMAKSRQVTKIGNAILNSGLNHPQQLENSRIVSFQQDRSTGC